jgi:hypothetical protein
MVAGTVALILCKYPGADLEEVRERLRRAQDVTEGHSSMEDPAGPGYDAATGHGLVNVEQACIYCARGERNERTEAILRTGTGTRGAQG